MNTVMETALYQAKVQSEYIYNIIEVVVNKEKNDLTFERCDNKVIIKNNKDTLQEMPFEFLHDWINEFIKTGKIPDNIFIQKLNEFYHS